MVLVMLINAFRSTTISARLRIKKSLLLCPVSKTPRLSFADWIHFPRTPALVLLGLVCAAVAPSAPPFPRSARAVPLCPCWSSSAQWAASVLHPAVDRCRPHH